MGIVRQCANTEEGKPAWSASETLLVPLTVKMPTPFKFNAHALTY